MKLFLVACEPSGDAHGAHLIEEIKKRVPGVEIRGLGGPKMKAAGAALLEDMTKISALGFGDVLRQYLRFREIFYRALAGLESFKPDAVLLIDSPAFNLRFAKKINKRFPVLYYISPQLWAWAPGRIKVVRKFISKMIVILPFEKELYEKAGVPCEFVGHPLLDQVKVTKDRAALREEFHISDAHQAIGIMPGSRESEVRRILPLMLKSARFLKQRIPTASFFLTRSPNVPQEIYDKILKSFPDVAVTNFAPSTNNDFNVSSATKASADKSRSLYDLIAALDFAFITSGTATTEAALIGTPFFLFYKAGLSTYLLGRSLIKVKFLGLVNILAGKRVVPEFIQGKIKPVTVAHEARVVLETPELYERMKAEFAEVKHKLGAPGASARAAEVVLESVGTGVGATHASH